MPIIPFNIKDIIYAKTVETSRLEFKAGLSEPTLRQVTATICAFANDFHNLNGGYIILGIEENEGVAQLPPLGIEPEKLDEFQKRIRGQCNRLNPEYYPIIEPLDFEGKKIIAIWCPAGEARPYQAPIVRGDSKEYAYFIRQGSETAEAKGAIREELLRLTSRIPFDDRAMYDLTFETLEQSLVRRFLREIRSKLSESNQPFLDTCLDLRLVRKVNGHFAPLHFALLFFTQKPDEFFAGAKAEIAQFGDDSGGSLIEEQHFSGPIDEQIRGILRFLENSTANMTQKDPNQAVALRSVAFPYAAMEEAIVNAFYHRGYDNSTEPVKIYLYPDRMEIISYPGPVPGIKPEHLVAGNKVPPVANRNRRVGDFLKQLGLAEMRNTGIPTIFKEMKNNGSPAPSFDFDEDRTYFRAVLPAHPKYVIIHAIREAAYLWTTGQKNEAFQRLAEAKHLPESGMVWAQMIDYKSQMGDLTGAELEWKELNGRPEILDKTPAAKVMARAFSIGNERQKALEILRNIRNLPMDAYQLTETALLYKNLNDFESAHKLFQNNISVILQDPRGLNEFADVKLSLAKIAYQQYNKVVNRRLLMESADLYRRAIQLTQDDVRKGWCFFRLAEIFQHLKRPGGEIEAAFRQSIGLLPDEKIVSEKYVEWQNRKN